MLIRLHRYYRIVEGFHSFPFLILHPAFLRTLIYFIANLQRFALGEGLLEPAASENKHGQKKASPKPTTQGKGKPGRKSDFSG